MTTFTDAQLIEAMLLEGYDSGAIDSLRFELKKQKALEDSDEALLEVYKNGDHFSVLLNDYRLAGIKVWGGTLVNSWKVSKKEMLEVLTKKENV